MVELSPPKTLNAKLQEIFENPIVSPIISRRFSIDPIDSSYEKLNQTIENFLKEELGSPMLPEDLNETVSLVFIEYARSGSAEKCQDLITEGFLDIKPDLNFPTIGGKTALHLAIESGQYQICEILISSGASINILDEEGSSPLHLACRLNREDIIRLLVRNGAYLDVRDSEGNTPIHYVAINANKNVYRIMIEHEANLNLVNREGKNPIECALGNDLGKELCTINIVRPFFKVLPKLIEDDVFEEETQQIQEPQTLEKIKAIRKIKNGEIVYLARLGNQLVSVKETKKALFREKSLHLKYSNTERTAHQAISHPFVNKLIDISEDETVLRLVFNYNSGGNLSKILLREHTLREEEAKFYIAESVLAIEAIHEQGFIYRNLKPTNIEIDEDGHIKLTSFGLAKAEVWNNKGAFSFFMSFSHLPPEVIHSDGHGRAVDWYMLGTLFYELVTGKPPFFSNKQEEMKNKILKGQLEIPRDLSIGAKDLLRKLLHKNPDERIGSKHGASEIKNHCFFEGIDWNEVVNKRMHPPFVTFFEESSCYSLSSYTNI